MHSIVIKTEPSKIGKPNMPENTAETTQAAIYGRLYIERSVRTIAASSAKVNKNELIKTTSGQPARRTKDRLTRLQKACSPANSATVSDSPNDACMCNLGTNRASPHAA